MVRILSNAERWLNSVLRQREMTQAELAEKIGMSAPAMTLTKQGRRRLLPQEASQIANVLMLPVAEVLEAFGVEYGSPWDNRYKVAGHVGNDEVVIIYPENAPDFGLQEIETPFIGFGGRILEIRGAFASPRYLPGEHIGISNEMHPSTQIGAEVIVEFEGGGTVLKRLQPGNSRETYTLVSLNPALEPMLGVRLNWACRVLLHLPIAGRHQGLWG